MFLHVHNPVSVKLVVLLCVVLASIPNEGAANNGSTIQRSAGLWVTSQASAIGISKEAPVKNDVTTQAQNNVNKETKTLGNSGASTKQSINIGTPSKVPVTNGTSSTKAPANTGSSTKPSAKDSRASTKAHLNNGVTTKTLANNSATATVQSTNRTTTKATTKIVTTSKAATYQGTTTKAPASSGGTPFDLPSVLSKLTPSSICDAVKQAAGALDLLKYAFIGMPAEHAPSGECLNHVTDFLKGVLSRQMWALKMVDAIGKPASGLLGGNFRWLGSFDECVDVRAAINQSGEITHPWKGQYCTAHFGLKYVGKQLGFDYEAMGVKDPGLDIGICLPNSCSDKDVTILIYKLLEVLQQNATLYEPYGHCQKESIPYDTKAIIALAICSVFVVLMILATLYDVIIKHVIIKQTKTLSIYPSQPSNIYVMTTNVATMQTNGHAMVMPSGEKMPYGSTIPNGEPLSNGTSFGEKMLPVDSIDKNQNDPTYDPGTVGKALLAFSVYTNGAKILNTHQPKGTLTAVNGIRFISMTWVILGHAWSFQLPYTSNTADYAAKAMKRFEFQAILNATVSVDTFFTLSGLLVSYLALKELKKRRGAKKFNWGMFYFHRFWRLTPPYMLFMMFYVCLSKYFYNGPNWSQEGIDSDKCGDYWWRNLLYINNLFPVENMCMAWTWYLANDMQFYVLSPLMLIPLYYSSVLGTLACAGLLAIHCGTRALLSNRDHFSPNIAFAGEATGVFNEMYDKPWTRIGTYVIGIYAGYILYRTSCKMRIPKIVNLLGWLLATGIAMSVLYGLYNDDGKPPHLSETLTTVYNSLARVGWAVAVCWVIVACATGHGGFINTLLSWKALIPLSRLTYCAYLVHPVVMYFFMMANRAIVYFTDIQGIYLFLGHLCISYAVAFVISLAFESPMMGLEKALLGRGKKS